VDGGGAQTAGVLCLVYGKFIVSSSEGASINRMLTEVIRRTCEQKELALAANLLTNLLLANAVTGFELPLNAIKYGAIPLTLYTPH
jgi:hypothetical protein